MIYSMLVCPSVPPEDLAARLSFSPADLFFYLTIRAQAI